MGNNNSTENMNKNARKAKGKKKRISIVFEVAALFLIGVIMTGLLTYVCENSLYSDSVVKQTESRAEEIANETKAAVTEYAAYDWLINYWYINYEDLDIEYDVVFSSSTATAGKCKVFSERHPELQLRYISSAQCESLPQEDQKLYAEIAYSWLITRIDQIKRNYPVSYLFCVISEEPFDKQFFLFSGADEGAVRGTNYEEVYTLGHKVSVSESQTVAMREATKNTSHLADADKYVDYYVLLWSFGEHNVFIGLTYDYSELQGLIDAQTAKGATLAILNQIILSVICLTLITLFVIVPLKKVQAFIRQYKNSKDSESVIAGLKKIELRNEIGELSEDTSEMIEEIENHIAELQTVTAEKERISTELSLATRIQAAMLPSTFPPFPWRREFDVFASMDPAKEVGGDFYDFFMLDDDHIALVIADVSGKGIPAALFMMISKILVKNYAMTGLSPAKTLEAVNRQICANNREEMFVT
ncbi:MAG: SpoIIE family protein phosphatase, partial [Clostridia bacterium]|nr:SpoIIE family protein phosphatase [Clostridia bacterium]